MPATTPKPISDRWPTLLGAGNAFVVNLPTRFSLKQSLEQATEIRLATAFAHHAGWYHMKAAIERGSASVRLLTGAEFFQTEPGLLESWLSLAQSSGNRVQPRLAADDPFFHPKALIVNGGAGCAFAIVGSGNLSQGGLRTNVECSVYVEDLGTIRQLIEWFDKQFDAGVKLNKDVIEKYQRMYERNQKRRTELQENQQRAVKELEAIGRAEMRKWDHAVNAAVQYFKGSTDELGWILIHSKQKYGGKNPYDSPQDEIEKGWKGKVARKRWYWILPRPMRERTGPFRLLLSWQGVIFGEFLASKVTRNIKTDAKKDGYNFAFVLDAYYPRKKIPLEKLHVPKHHRSIIKLDERILTHYEKAVSASKNS